VKIKVTDENLTKIWDALDRSNGKARKNTALPGDVFALAERAEQSLADSGLPLREHSGTEVRWHAAGATANAYGYRMLRTRISLTRGTKGWFLTGLERVELPPRQNEFYRLVISPAQRERIVAAALATFEVRDNTDTDIKPSAVEMTELDGAAIEVKGAMETAAYLES
jgi:hypothetical protein